MTDDTYPGEWLSGPVHPMDPRLSDVLEDYRPTDAQRAAVAELWNSYASRRPAFTPTYLEFGARAYEEFSWLPLFLALLEQATLTAIGSQGELALTRLRADLCVALDDAAEEAPQ